MTQFSTHCLVCDELIELSDLSLKGPFICEDCKQAILWAKKQRQTESTTSKINTDGLCNYVFQVNSNLNRDTVREVCEILQKGRFVKVTSDSESSVDEHRVNESLGILGE